MKFKQARVNGGSNYDSLKVYITVVAVKQLVVLTSAQVDWSALWVSIWLGLAIFLVIAAALDCVVRNSGHLLRGNQSVSSKHLPE